MSEFIDTDESDDPDYVPPNEELSETSDSEPDVQYNDDEMSRHNLSTVSVSSNGQSCIKKNSTQSPTNQQ